MKKSINDRFWTKVNKNGPTMEHMYTPCWEWTAGTTIYGYGNFYNGVKLILSHRFSWILHNGEIRNNLWVLHRCDNPPCINPDHLFLGTHKDNMKDCSNKNRTCRGSKQGNSKLTEDNVLEIYKLFHEEKMTQKDISIKFRVARTHISDIVRGRRWSHIIPKTDKKFLVVGSRSKSTKLTEQLVLEIRHKYNSGGRRKDIMNEYNISSSALHYILTYQSWKHI